MLLKQPGKVTFTAGHFAQRQALNETSVYNLCLTQYWTFMLWSIAVKIGLRVSIDLCHMTRAPDILRGRGAVKFR